MLNPLWVGCSNTWSHHENDTIWSGSNKHSEPMARRPLLKEGRAAQPWPRGLRSAQGTRPTRTFGAAKQVPWSEEKYKQELLHQPYRNLLGIMLKDNVFLQIVFGTTHFEKKCKSLTESRSGIISSILLTWFMSIQTAWDMTLFSKGKNE